MNDQDLSELKYALTGLKGVATYADIIEELETLKETSVDFYGAFCNLLSERLSDELKGGVFRSPAMPGLQGCASSADASGDMI